MREQRKKDVTWKIGHRKSLPTTPSENTTDMFNCSIHQLHPISRLPGLNPDSENVAKYQVKDFRKYRVQESNETNFIKLCRQGGRKDLLYHDELNTVPHQEETSEDKKIQLHTTNNRENRKRNEKANNNIQSRCLVELNIKENHRNHERKEIPIIDQIHVPKHKPKYRPDIVPV